MSSDPVKDPFQILADELTLIRRDMDELRRTSLDKDEAESLNEVVANAVDHMRRAAAQAPERLKEALRIDRNRMAEDALQSAREAARGAVEGVRAELVAARQDHARAAGEARREAWRWFGGFWVWLAAMLAMGAVLGALAALWIGGTISARDFGQFPRVFCSSAGGQVVERDDGASFCAVWIERPKEERP